MKRATFWTIMLGVVVLGVLLAPMFFHAHDHGPPYQQALQRMMDGAKAYYSADNCTIDGTMIPHQLLPSAPPTPTEICPHRAVPLNHPIWQALHMPSYPGMRLTYTHEAADRFLVRVNGDADCDGVESTFERRCTYIDDIWQCVPFEANPLE